MPPVTKFYRCLGSGKRIPSTKIGDNIVGITAQCYQLLFCFSFQVDCNDASDELSLVTVVQRDEEEAIEETIANMYEMNQVNGITAKKKVDGGGDKEEPGHNLTIGDGGGVKKRRDVEQQQQSPTIDAVNKSLLTGQPPSSSCDCYGFDDGDWVALLLFGKLLKKTFFG